MFRFWWGWCFVIMLLKPDSVGECLIAFKFHRVINHHFTFNFTRLITICPRGL